MTPVSQPAAYPETERLRARPLVHAFIVVAFSYLFLANAWLGDDAYITFRVAWNLVHGYGPVFNPGERVQAYTHPLWMLVISVAHAVTREFFFTAIAVSYGFALAALLRVVRNAESLTAGVIALVWLASSKAFVDYLSSGLEYPLSYLLLAIFYTQFFRVSDAPLLPGQLRSLGLVAGLAFVNRMDSVLLYAPPLAWLAMRSLRRNDERSTPLVAGFGIPAAAWLLFATLYYGFPLPNTYYAKVAAGIPSPLMYRQGVAYLFNSLGQDPMTLGTVGLAVLLAIRSPLTIRLAAAAALSYVAYTLSVGGDFMSGRFFAMPFFVSVLAVLRAMAGLRYQPIAAAGLVLYNLVQPLAPVKTTPSYAAGWPWRTQNGIRDERGHLHQATNILFYSPFRELPDHTWMREGLSFRNGPEKVTVQGSIGYYGLSAGPEKHLVDRNALSDPLLARLPVSPRLYFEFYAGHYFRDIPGGYLETVSSGTNRIADPAIHDYYDTLSKVIHGPTFSRERLRAIWHLNAGAGRRFADQYDRARRVDLSIRASNERFVVDAGQRDEPAGVIRSIGRPGYLQYGPGIPMKRGTYRARWVGTVSGAPGAPLGFVDVWSGNHRLARRQVAPGETNPEARQIAEIEFVLPQDTLHLDYRLWVDGSASVTLERVELSSVERPRF